MKDEKYQIGIQENGLEKSVYEATLDDGRTIKITSSGTKALTEKEMQNKAKDNKKT